MSNVAQLPTVQPTQVLDTRYTQDVVPILDTSKFEHMQRIAVAMAECSTIPDSFRFKEGKPEKGELPRATVVANCFRVVNQAVRWGLDPFAVMDCASIVHGKLMWEGKLVAAVVDAKTGVRLNYTFDDKPGRDLGVTVSGTLPGENEPRTIEGKVKYWHRGDKSPWANEGDWKRQLRYRGAREWARAHTPSVMLGIYSDDELHEIASLDVPAGQRAQRMKDITPAPPLLDVPDIPDVKPDTQGVISGSQSQDKTPDTSHNEVDTDADIADVDGFLAKLEDDIHCCESADELAEIAESNADLIARLPATGKARAVRMLQNSAE